ncbi:unnamed protein product [Symbiodinium sp. CCMP2592]|nr:unnamed protein product [Symbiodinium sp. CCMP2592]CAE7800840.1 unnamed protein product [Symbiodinium sp. CCMP2592]CAE7810718.1 unnamed protein product [Symbiodinium sp. CCMP2592]
MHRFDSLRFKASSFPKLSSKGSEVVQARGQIGDPTDLRARRLQVAQAEKPRTGWMRPSAAGTAVHEGAANDIRRRRCDVRDLYQKRLQSLGECLGRG